MTASPASEVPARSRFGPLASAALLLSASFVASRVLGLVRTVIIADVFGNSRTIEAYFAAFRIPDTMFLLVSGGALATAFIPVFARLLEEDNEAEAWKVASSVLNTICIALGVLAVIAFLIAPQLMEFLAGGFSASQQSLTVSLTRIMLLQPIFLGASALVSAILQTYGRFVLTAISPLVYNVAVVVGALLGHKYGVESLAWSVVVGAAAQLLLQLPGVSAEAKALYRFSVDLHSQAVQQIGWLFLPRVLGLAAFQAMMFITLFLASRLPKGSYGAINYSWLLILFPVGALGTAAGTAIFPTLSRLTASNDMAAVRRTVHRSLRLVLFLALPSAVGLIVLRRPIVNLLYLHGSWTPGATEQTAFALLFYSLALAPMAAIEVLPRVFYAMQDTITPVRIAVIAVGLDAILSIVFVRVLPPSSGQGGLAFATAIATSAQAVWLAAVLDRRVGGIGRRGLYLVLRDAVTASVSMGIVLYVLLEPLTAVLPQHGFGALITVAVEMCVGVAVFSGSSYLLGAPELWQVRGFLTSSK